MNSPSLHYIFGTAEDIQFSLPHINATYQFPTEGKGEEEPLEITGGSVPPSSPTPPPTPGGGGGGGGGFLTIISKG